MTTALLREFGYQQTAASQSNLILRALRQGEEVTALDALGRWGCFRLAARVQELRLAGHPILTETRLVNGKRIARYRYLSSAEQLLLGVG